MQTYHGLEKFIKKNNKQTFFVYEPYLKNYKTRVSIYSFKHAEM